MSQSVEALWKSVLKLLQQLPAQGPEQQWAAVSTIALQIGVLVDKENLPRATWKHLIRELKVPLQLATICRGLEFTSSSGGGGSSDGGISSGGGGSSSGSGNSRANALCIAMWSWKALILFLSAAAKNFVPETYDPVAGQRASSTSLPSAVTAQLQQSGLLQQFPSTLLTAAQLLKDATTTAGASRYRAPAGATSGQAAAAAAAAASPSSSRGSNVRDSIAYADLLLLAADLASAVHMLGCFKAQDEPVPETARRLDAAACFCLAIMQLVTAALDSVPAECSTAPVMLGDIYCGPVRLAVTGLLYVVEEIKSSTVERLAQLLQSPNIRAAVTVAACTCYARTLMPSTSGKLSSNSIAAATAAAAAAAATAQRQGQFDWQAAAVFCTPSDPPQPQPQQQQQQFEPCLAATGVSIHAAAWAAAWMDSTQVKHLAVTVVRSMSAVVHLLELQVVAFKQQQWQQLQQRESFGSAELLFAQQAAQHLLLLQLLLCSIEQQPGLLGSDFEWCAAVLAHATMATTQSFTDCYMAAAVAGCEKQQQPSSSTAAGAAAAAAAAPTAAPAAAPAAAPTAAATAGLITQAEPRLDQATELLPGWCACMLPTLVALLQQAQQRERARHTAEAAAATSRSSGNNSSSSQLPQAQRPTEDAILPLVGVLTMAAQNVAATRPCEGTPSAQLPSVGLVKHCTPIYAALDGCLRLQVGSSGALINSTDACKLVDSVASLLLGDVDRPVAASAVLAGPGSAEQRQLFSMLFSLLKVCGALSAVAWNDASLVGRCSPQQAAEGGPMCAALTAACCLPDRCDPLPDTHSSTGEMAASAASGSSAAATAAAAPGSAGQTEVAAAAAAPIDSLPALVLCGCCCLQWASQLKMLGEQRLLLQQVNPDSPEGAGKTQVRFQHAAVGLFAGPEAWAAGVLLACRDWLSLGGTAEALAAAGYPAEALLQKLGVLLELLGQPAAAPDASTATVADEVYDEVVQQLQAVGLAFNTLAFPDACNNPFCSNMSGATELESVSGRANMCAGCLVARYCSKACQASHWKQHKAVCKAIRAAAVSDTTKAG